MKLVEPLEVEEPAHPLLFLILALPAGILQGYVTITLAYLYAKAGISVAAIATLIAAGLIPSTFKFFWAPLIDVTFTVKKWFLLATLLIAASILGLSIMPVNTSVLPLATGVVLISYFALTFQTMSINSLMAHDTSHETKGRASGYFQGGATGGVGIGGGAGLWLASRVSSQWMTGAVLAIFCMLCCVAILYVKEPEVTVRVKKVTQTMGNLLKDIWQVLKTRVGVFALFLSFLPFGTGSAGTLFAAVANDWKASADVVALLTGTLGGIITVAGCILGGWLCDLMNRQVMYVMFGLFQGVCAVGMAFCPHTQLMYIIWTSLYSLSNGLAYAGFTAFVLEAIGKGAAATKYNVFAGLSNIPIYVVTLVDGWAYTRWHASGMLNIEAAIAVFGVVLFFVINALSKSKQGVEVR